MTEPTVGPPAATRDNLAIGAYVAAGLILIGSLGPWGTVLGLSVAGTEGDGVITLIFGVAAAIMVYLTVSAGASKPKFRAQWVTVALGALTTVIAIFDIFDISSNEAVSPGWGIWLVLLAGGALTFAGIQLARRLSR